MNSRAHTSLRAAFLGGLAALLLSAAGCSSKAPPEANAALDAALSALAGGNPGAFVGALVPAQRATATALPQWGFFQATRSHSIDNEFDTEVTEGSAAILTTLYFDEQREAHNNVYFVMKKTAGGWLIDLDETIKKQIARDGAQAFEAWKLEIR